MSTSTLLPRQHTFDEKFVDLEILDVFFYNGDYYIKTTSNLSVLLLNKKVCQINPWALVAKCSGKIIVEW